MGVAVDQGIVVLLSAVPLVIGLVLVAAWRARSHVAFAPAGKRRWESDAGSR